MANEIYLNKVEAEALVSGFDAVSVELYAEPEGIAEVAERGDSPAMRAFANRIDDLSRLYLQYIEKLSVDGYNLRKAVQSIEDTDAEIGTSL